MSNLGQPSNQLCAAPKLDPSEPATGEAFIPEEGEEESVEEEGATNGQAPAWAGFVSPYFGNPQKFQAVEGTFIQPFTYPDKCATSKVSSWVGLGGWELDRLIQAGITVEPDGETYPWYEWLSANDLIEPESLTPLLGVVKPTHVVHVRVSYNSTTQKALFFVNDLSAEKHDAMVVQPFNGITGPRQSGSTSEDRSADTPFRSNVLAQCLGGVLGQKNRAVRSEALVN